MIYDGGAATDMICRVIPFRPPLLGWGGAPALLVVSRVVAGATNDMPAVGLELCRQSTAASWQAVLLMAARLSLTAVRGFLRALMGC